MSFQSKINLDLARGWHGDFASANPRISLLGKDGGFQVGPTGIGAGSFVWISPLDGTVCNVGKNSPDGFVARELYNSSMPGTIENTIIITPGSTVTVYEKGEFLVELAADMGAVNRNDVVHVSSTTGNIVASTDKNAVTTGYKYAENAKGGDLVKISAWI